MSAWVAAGKVRISAWRKRVWRTFGMSRHRRRRYWTPVCVRPLCTNRVHSANVCVESWICSAVGDIHDLLSRPLGDLRHCGRVTDTKSGLGGMARLCPPGIDGRALPKRAVQEGAADSIL
jgi:hypothetical protein